MNGRKSYKGGDRIFYIIITLILTFFFLAVLYPCIFVISAAFSSGTAVQAGKVILWPVDISFEGFKMVLNTKDVWIGFMNSVFYTIAATILGIVLTMIGGYVLARHDLPGRNAFMLYFAFTMFFSGGMIPNYILIKSMGMLNTRWAIIIPGALSVYNMVMARTFIQSNIPREILEAAQMDGCSDFRFLIQVVMPLSKAIVAVLVLFYGVAKWNEYFNAMIYLYNESLYPLAVVLRQILSATQIDPNSVTDPELQMKLAELVGVMKYALIVVSMVPIMLIYPFIQKYFVQGVMIGSVKG